MAHGGVGVGGRAEAAQKVIGGGESFCEMTKTSGSYMAAGMNLGLRWV